MRGSACVLAVILAVASIGFTPTRAVADGTRLHLCNHSQYRIDVAVGYHSSGPNDTGNVLTGPFVSHGWYILQPGECGNFPNPFSARYMYWSGFRQGALLINQSDTHFCVPSMLDRPPEFTFERQNESDDACANSTPADSSGPNQWIASHEVDVMVDPDADYDGS